MKMVYSFLQSVERRRGKQVNHLSGGISHHVFARFNFFLPSLDSFVTINPYYVVGRVDKMLLG